MLHEIYLFPTVCSKKKSALPFFVKVLLISVKALWGVIDKSNTLRDALYHTLYAMETV